MWYEVLPSFMIIVGAMGFPHLSAYYVNKMVIGNYYRRNLVQHDERIMYLRDSRLSGGDPYNVKGLESIPDQE